MYECLIGYPPFCSESPQETCQKILQWKENLVIPADVHLSPTSIDLIQRLLCGVEERLTVLEIKNHPFFEGINWDELRSTSAPYVPQISSDLDTSHFPIDELEHVDIDIKKDWNNQQTTGKNSNSNNGSKDLAFVGYTFKRFDH